MALFQPTNIIPSADTNSGTVSVADTMQVQWQVNGNSAMTAFQIDFYQNDTASTFITSTGRIDGYSFTNESGQTLSLPFYGTDRFGRPQFFTYAPSNTTWASWNFTDGNNYKLKITQWFKASENVVSNTPNGSMSANTKYYFSVTGGGYITFTPATAIPSTTKIYYNVGQQKCWYFSSTNELILLSVAYTTTAPTGATNRGNLITDTVASAEDFVTQISPSVFITRTAPTLTIYTTDKLYNPANNAPLQNNGTIATSIGHFHAAYDQAQGDPVRWIRWQIATATYNTQTKKWTAGDILADTGDIYTPTLNYEFNGFFDGNSYAIRCQVETESGLSKDTDWIFFNVQAENQGDYSGNFTVQCLPKENATLLEWEGVEVIPPSTSPNGYNPIPSNGAVTLNPNSSITWSKTGAGDNQEDMNFDAPWTAVWKGEISFFWCDLVSSITKNGTALNGTVTIAVFSPDGKTLVLGGNFSGYASVFSVNGTTITYVGDITKNGTALFRAYAAAFSPDGGALVLSGEILGIGGREKFTSIYSVSGTTITYVGDITRSNTPLDGAVYAATFSPDGKTLVLGGNFSGYASVFSVNGTTITYVGDIFFGGNVMDGAVYAATFSPDGKTLVFGGSFKDSAYAFQVEGTTLLAIGPITKRGVALSGETYAAAFSPDGKTLVLGGNFSGRASVFFVSGTTITYVGDITKNGTAFNSTIQTAVFSPDGKTLVLGWLLHEIFSVSGTTITYVGEIWGESWGLTGVAFSPDGGTLVLSDFQSPYAAVFEYENPINPTHGKLFEITENGLALQFEDNKLFFELNSTQIGEFSCPPRTLSVAAIISGSSLNVYFYGKNGLISQSSMPITYTQQPLTSVTIYGGDSGVTVDSVSVYQGNGSNVLSLYEASDFEPVWDSDGYDLYMTANFNGDLQGGTGTSGGEGFYIYRQEIGSNILTPIANVSPETTSLKDYGISSGKAYNYYLYVIDAREAFMNQVEGNQAISACFKNYSLLVCDYDEEKDEYHVRKQYLFALNLNVGSVSNNNSPTINANFTPYPTRMPSAQNYASGTLSGLIGAIYTKQAVVDQIEYYKHTLKPSTLDYFDSVDLEQELRDLSVTPYQLFLRDMKGRLRMVHTSDAITTTTDIKPAKQPITISIPWVEVGDASDVTIIQTPDDYGWDNDNQILDVTLDVNIQTGELSATYPYPYNGTKFYLAGGTPIGTTPAQVTMSEVAKQPTDGQVTANVKVNREVDDE